MGNLGIYANQSIVSGEKISRQYTVQTAGFSYWPQGTNTVFKINYYDKDYSSETKNDDDTDGFDMGIGYEF